MRPRRALRPPTTVDAKTLNGVACPSASQCTAVDAIGQQVTVDPGAPGTPPGRPWRSASSFTARPSCAPAANAPRTASSITSTPCSRQSNSTSTICGAASARRRPSPGSRATADRSTRASGPARALGATPASARVRERAGLATEQLQVVIKSRGALLAAAQPRVPGDLPARVHHRDLARADPRHHLQPGQTDRDGGHARVAHLRQYAWAVSPSSRRRRRT